MITVNSLKQYLYLPEEVTQDDLMISGFIESGYIYLRNAVNDFDKLYEENSDFEKQADFFVKLYAAECYQNRNQYTEGGVTSFMIRSLMLQLQTYYVLNANNEGEQNA